eukprot:1116131-Amphidinium_carterae.1
MAPGMVVTTDILMEILHQSNMDPVAAMQILKERKSPVEHVELVLHGTCMVCRIRSHAYRHTSPHCTLGIGCHPQQDWDE